MRLHRQAPELPDMKRALIQYCDCDLNSIGMHMAPFVDVMHLVKSLQCLLQFALHSQKVLLEKHELESQQMASRLAEAKRASAECERKVRISCEEQLSELRHEAARHARMLTLSEKKYADVSTSNAELTETVVLLRRKLDTMIEKREDARNDDSPPKPPPLVQLSPIVPVETGLALLTATPAATAVVESPGDSLRPLPPLISCSAMAAPVAPGPATIVPPLTAPTSTVVGGSGGATSQRGTSYLSLGGSLLSPPDTSTKPSGGVVSVAEVAKTDDASLRRPTAAPHRHRRRHDRPRDASGSRRHPSSSSDLTPFLLPALLEQTRQAEAVNTRIEAFAAQLAEQRAVSERLLLAVQQGHRGGDACSTEDRVASSSLSQQFSTLTNELRRQADTSREALEACRREVLLVSQRLDDQRVAAETARVAATSRGDEENLRILRQLDILRTQLTSATQTQACRLQQLEAAVNAMPGSLSQATDEAAGGIKAAPQRVAAAGQPQVVSQTSSVTPPAVALAPSALPIAVPSALPSRPPSPHVQAAADISVEGSAPLGQQLTGDATTSHSTNDGPLRCGYCREPIVADGERPASAAPFCVKHCSHCRAKIGCPDLSAHEQSCELRFVNCDTCKAPIWAKVMTEHSRTCKRRASAGQLNLSIATDVSLVADGSTVMSAANEGARPGDSGTTTPKGPIVPVATPVAQQRPPLARKESELDSLRAQLKALMEEEELAESAKKAPAPSSTPSA